jgi:hypothetical protein
LGRLSAAIAVLGLAALAGCGDGERQDENEPEGDFAVQMLDASFPARQRLAQRSTMRITVRNAGDETIPNVTVTVDGFDFERSGDGELADRSRPRFAVNGVPVEIGGTPDAREDVPRGCDTAYVNTWACGPLRPDRQKEFRWSVTPVVAGPFRIDYRVAAGLDGNARAVTAAGGDPPMGSFRGTVSDAAPQSRIGGDGKSIVSGSR